MTCKNPECSILNKINSSGFRLEIDDPNLYYLAEHLCSNSN